MGGPLKVVEIDEAKTRKRKYNRGRLIKGQWVFGGIERGSGLAFVIPVEDRTADTVSCDRNVCAARKIVSNETTIVSDCWKAW